MISRYLTAVKVPEKIGIVNFFEKNIFMVFVPLKKIGPIILRLEIAAQTPTFWGCKGTCSKKLGFSELHYRMFCDLT
jgi:hypothetical protein